MTSRLSLMTAVGAVVGMAALAFWRSTLDVFGTTKATAVVLGALLLGTVVLFAGLRAGRLVVPWGPWPLAVLVMGGGLVGGVVVSDTPLRSVVGVPGRHGGLGLYVACLVLGLLAAHAIRAEGALDRLTGVLGLTAVPVVAYVLLQAVGADPFTWGTVEGGVPWFSTFGNVDFASAWIGVVGVLVAGVVADPSRHPHERGGAAALVVAAVVAAVLTGSLQGPVVLGLGLPAVAGVALRDRVADRVGDRRLLAVAGVLVVLGLVGLVVVAGGLRDDAGRSLETRVPKWRAALVMAGDAPLLGHGLDTFGDRFFAARDPATAAADGLERSVDNAHSVPLHLLSGGGALLAGGWLAVVVVVPAVGVWRRRPPIALVMAWVGYLLASAVSIDVPPMAVLGAVLTGALAGSTGMAGVRPVALAVPAGPRVAGAAVVGLAAVVLLVPLTAPLRADALGFRAETARLVGASLAASDLAGRATATAPWASRYPADQGAWLTGQGFLEVALPLQAEALRREPRSLTHALNVARLLAALGQTGAAGQAYQRVLEIDPHTPAVQAEAAALGR